MTPVRTELLVGEEIFAPKSRRERARVVIGHGVNTQGVMGAGFAAQVSRRYPALLPDYRDACRRGDLSPGCAWMVPVDDRGTLVANIASQCRTGKDARPDWLRQALRDANDILAAQHHQFELRLPLIGAGIGGLAPTQAADIIFECADEAPENVSTHLYLLPEDPHTHAVSSRHAWWYRVDAAHGVQKHPWEGAV